MRAIIFDLGQVLVGYDPIKTANAIAAMSNVHSERIDGLFRRIIPDAELGIMGIGEMHRHYQDMAGYTGSLDEFTTAFCAGLSRLEEPLAYAAVLCSRDDVKVGAISNTYYGHSEWLDENVPELKRFGVVSRSNLLRMAKPKADIYNYTLAALGVDAKDAIFVDDVLRNVDGALAVGMSAIHHRSWDETKIKLEEWLSA